jgi:type II secretory pathway pseudopilin PulG
MRNTSVGVSFDGDLEFAPQGCSRIHERLASQHQGFTLVEVVVAFAIMFILVLGLSAGFSYSQRVARQAQLSAMAQNLMDLQVEELRSFSPGTLGRLVDGTLGVDTALVNYPHYSVGGVDPDGDKMLYAYDQTSDTDPATKGVFYVVNLIDTVEKPSGGTPYSAPEIIGGDVLLGSSVSVQPVTPPLPASPYYNVLFFQDMYPTLARRIRIERIPAGADGNNEYAYVYSVAILSRTQNGELYSVLQELTGVITPLATGTIGG